MGVLLGQLLQVDAGHGLHDHVLGVRVVALDIVGDDVVVHVGADAGLVDPLVEELLAQGRIGVQGLGHEVFQVHDLDALLAQNSGEGVVLGLGDLQKRDVVEQQLLQRVRGEIQKLVPRAMKDNLLEVADLALDVYSLHVTLRSGASAPLDCRLPRFPSTATRVPKELARDFMNPMCRNYEVCERSKPVVARPHQPNAFLRVSSTTNLNRRSLTLFKNSDY